MHLRKSALALLLPALLAGCVGIYSTDYNLDFEHSTDGKLPLRWGIADQTYHGYASSMDFRQAHSGCASLRMEQTDSAKSGWAIFSRTLPAELVAGHEVELSGWVRTQDAGGFADLYLIPDEQMDYNALSLDDGLRGVRSTTDWTRISVSRQIPAGSSDVTFGGIVSGGGKVWFDHLELTIDGRPIADTIVPAPKIRLTSADKKELRKYIYPLHSLDPATADTTDLQVLGKLVGDSRVVALGENTHGSSEIFRLKHRMIRYLAANEGFDIFSIEANMPESYRLNEYTVAGKGDPKSLIAGMYFWTWNTREMLDMVQWMRFFNRSQKKIAYTGFDMQVCDKSADILQEAFANDPQAAHTLENRRTELAKAHTYSSIGAPQINAQIAESIRAQLSRIESQIDRLPADESQRAWLRQNATLLRQYLGQTTRLWRDRCMAENVLWIKEQNPLSRIVVWAHNGHIAPCEGRMGEHLEKRLGDDYLTFGFTFYEGKYTGIHPDTNSWEQEAQRAYPGTLEYLLGALDEPIFILDLKQMRTDNSPALEWMDDLRFRQVGAVRLDNEFPGHQIIDTFDYLVFIRQSSPSQLL